MKILRSKILSKISSPDEVFERKTSLDQSECVPAKSAISTDTKNYYSQPSSMTYLVKFPRLPQQFLHIRPRLPHICSTFALRLPHIRPTVAPHSPTLAPRLFQSFDSKRGPRRDKDKRKSR